MSSEQYKYKDAQGTTSYSQLQPPKGTEYELISIDATGKVTVIDNGVVGRASTKEQEAAKRAGARALSEAEAKRVAAQNAADSDRAAKLKEFEQSKAKLDYARGEFNRTREEFYRDARALNDSFAKQDLAQDVITAVVAAFGAVPLVAAGTALATGAAVSTVSAEAGAIIAVSSTTASWVNSAKRAPNGPKSPQDLATNAHEAADAALAVDGAAREAMYASKASKVGGVFSGIVGLVNDGIEIVSSTGPEVNSVADSVEDLQGVQAELEGLGNSSQVYGVKLKARQAEKAAKAYQEALAQFIAARDAYAIANGTWVETRPK